MKLYIPVHLKDITILSQLSSMIAEYANIYEGSSDSFSEYYYYESSDPVETFVRFCLLETDIAEGSNYDNVVDYIVRLFYSVKGSVKVFEYLRRYLTIFEIDGDITYMTGGLSIKFTRVNVSDEGAFINYLQDLLETLLYFNSEGLSLTVDDVNLTIEGTIENLVGSSSINYFNFTAEPYEISN